MSDSVRRLNAAREGRYAVERELGWAVEPVWEEARHATLNEG